jgi:1-aminocyclopropane-1-carboxylate deaminase/D-cysteine desulfhydrase-like pyridoxal-dependent ACC family enzyme
LVSAANLSRYLGENAPEILVKMDAETGLALGGNKLRKLEMELGGDRLAGVTHLITTGGPQSNHCRMTAGAAAHLGLGCVLVINGSEPGVPRGNALLHRLFGAEIRTVKSRDERAPAMERASMEIREKGGKALVLPLGASTGLGALGYALGALELATQLSTLAAPGRTWIFVSASSCGTLAGLLLGLSLLGRRDARLVGVSADVSADDMWNETRRLADEGARILEWAGPILEEILTCDDSQVGEGYGIPTEATHEAIALFGSHEGIVLDPVYTGKAAAGLLAWVRDGRVSAGERAVFVHTGGHPALLA